MRHKPYSMLRKPHFGMICKLINIVVTFRLRDYNN
uniref:Uncharacterized protein n=1 Tax=Siphoviridae sp. cto3L1 TaxID=2827942 RepID=A0A8S5SRN6_9CAUD|nr:MAG TPA: hypothetical protein [Siphoviridae sp. cto3L1]